ncbi:MAG: alternative ribosome rescue aminoacyl-tRNA hydrolase ArfB [Chloroflexota bacterium]
MARAPISFRLDPDEIRFEFFRASGPGGQNVNKVSSAVRLRFDVGGSASLPPEVKQRLKGLAGKRLTDDGVLTIEARRYRTQEQNREEAIRRLMGLVARAWLPPRPRRPTRPSAASRARRLEAKRRRARTKTQRARVREVE